MAIQIEVFDLTQILSPIQRPEDARMDAVVWGANLTITKGQAGGIKTSDQKMYPLNVAATDGTQLFKGFAKMSFKTDANGMVFYGPSTTPSFRTGPWSTSAIYKSGIFDPMDLQTAATGTPVAEVDTFTPATPTAGDVIGVNTPGGIGVQIIVGTSPSATTITTQLKNAWNSDASCTNLATATGTATFILTAVTAGVPLNLVPTIVGTGTFTKVVTTAAVSAAQGEVDTFTPTGSVTTGDVWTLTYTNGALQTFTITQTVGSTATATAISGLLIAAWNADPVLSTIATASGTSTVILTAAYPGQPLGVTAAVVGTGTVGSAVTKAAAGRSISDILPGAPGSRVLHNGFWEIL